MTQPCIFVTGIWKSGNHLAYAALNELGIAGPFNGLSGHLLFGRHAWAKRLLRAPRGAGDAVQVGLETDARVSARYVARSVRRLSGRILGGHAAFSPALDAVLRDTGAVRVCIRRDPRDILVSFADWIGSRPDFYLHPAFVHLSRNDRIARLLDGTDDAAPPINAFTTVLDRAAGWLDASGVLQIRFEDLVGQSGGGDRAAQRAALAALHAHVGAPRPLAAIDADRIYGGTLTFNKGRSQRWREIDDAALLARIETRLAPHLDRWGYAP